METDLLIEPVDTKEKPEKIPESDNKTAGDLPVRTKKQPTQKQLDSLKKARETRRMLLDKQNLKEKKTILSIKKHIMNSTQKKKDLKKNQEKNQKKDQKNQENDYILQYGVILTTLYLFVKSFTNISEIARLFQKSPQEQSEKPSEQNLGMKENSLDLSRFLS